MISADMIGLLERQEKLLREVVEIALRQREALRQGRLDLLQDLLDRMRQTAFEAQQIESDRNAAAQALAASLGVEPRLDVLAEAIGGAESRRLLEVGGALTLAVAAVKSEMQILTRLMEESSTLNDMLLSEWHRLQGGIPFPGGFDARG
ncbi:MAG: flagellar export chaperone FlgN [Synergistales bacterium]|nr:flagellar export chaperone FlgN [Synergistales bacterium]